MFISFLTDKQEKFEYANGGNQKPKIEVEQTTQWPKEKRQKVCSTKYYTGN